MTDQLNKNIFSESDAKLIVNVHNEAQDTAIQLVKALEKGKIALVEANGKQLFLDLEPLKEIKTLDNLKYVQDTQELRKLVLDIASSVKTLLHNQDSILFSLAKSACHLANEGLNRIEDNKLINLFVTNNVYVKANIDAYKDAADFFEPFCKIVETFSSPYDSKFAAVEAKIIDLVDTLSHPYTNLFDL